MQNEPVPPAVTVRPNVAVGTAAAAFLPLVVILFRLVNGEGVDAAALAGAITPVTVFVVAYFSPALRKTVFAGLGGAIGVVVTALVAIALGVPYDVGAATSAAAAILAVLFVAFVPNTVR